MDELYGDLENYEFDNIVAELRNENQELKCKVDEYATTMASLQKDFDKLSADYKKLELNYSSLLKTARAEIERKSQMITNLNMEKDKLVLEAIQKHGRVLKRNKNLTGNKLQAGKLTKEGDLAKKINDVAVLHTNDKKISGTMHHDKKNNQEKRREEEEKTFSQDPGLINEVNLKENTQNLIKHELHKDKDIKKDEYKKRKENHIDVFDKGGITSNDKTTLSQGSSAKDIPDVKENEEKSKNIDFFSRNDREHNKYERKKSKDNHLDELSNSDVACKLSKIRHRRKSMPLMNRNDYNYSSDEDQNDGPNDHRFRRKSPLRDNRKYYDQYHCSRNSERKGPDLTRVGDKNVSNYESSRNLDRKSSSWYRDNDRHKNRDNREKYESNQRSRRHYSPDRPYRIHGEYNNKYRESNDRHRFDNVRHRTFVNPLSERYNSSRRSREFDGQGFQHDVLLNPIKHKLYEETEEPVCKRSRRDSLNNPSDKVMFTPDRDTVRRANSASKQLELSYLSVQSPDHVHLENYPPIHHVKVIKNDSDTKLDDPRLTSKKYIFYTHCDKPVLSTVAGKDVNIKAIDTNKWYMNRDKNTCERYEMPTPLKEKPPVNDDLVNNIYMAIDNPISNLSLESGEICIEDELDVVKIHKQTSNVDHDCNIKSVCDKNIQRKDINMLTKKEPVDIIDNGQQSCSSSFSKKYRIPKVKKSNSPILSDKVTSKTHDVVRSDNTKQGHKKKSNKEKRLIEKKIQPVIIANNSSMSFSDTTEIYNDKKAKLVEPKHRKQSPEKRKISSKDTVEGDLELSDETCDYVEVPEQTKSDKENITQHSKFGETNKNVIDSFQTDLITGNPAKAELTINKHGIEMSHDNKHFDLINKSHEAHLKESMSNTYKEKKSKEIKSKLCDLFGDTSSLITLDDLGIVAPSSTKVHLNEYTPLFESTQDAVDLNVEEMEKVQAWSSTIKCDVNDPLTKDGNEHKIPENTMTRNKDKPCLNKENQKINNVENSSSIQHIFENVNTEPQDNNVVKTIIISTGVQNNCLSTDSTVQHGEHEKQPTNIDKKSNDNATRAEVLLGIKALATSTPYKPQNEPSLIGPENRHSNNSTAVKDDSNILSNTKNIYKGAQSNADIPDVRIIVKRRRKAKAAPP